MSDSPRLLIVGDCNVNFLGPQGKYDLKWQLIQDGRGDESCNFLFDNDEFSNICSGNCSSRDVLPMQGM